MRKMMMEVNSKLLKERAREGEELQRLLVVEAKRLLVLNEIDL
jgi:hypothetical protein